MSIGFYWVERTCTSLIISERLKSLQTPEFRRLFIIFHASWRASAEAKVPIRGNKSVREWETESVFLAVISGECRKCRPRGAGDHSENQLSWSPEPRHGGVLAITSHWDPSTGARPGCSVGCTQPVGHTLGAPGVYSILFHFTLCWLGAISVGYSAL